MRRTQRNLQRRREAEERQRTMVDAGPNYVAPGYEHGEPATIAFRSFLPWRRDGDGSTSTTGESSG